MPWGRTAPRAGSRRSPGAGRGRLARACILLAIAAAGALVLALAALNLPSTRAALHARAARALAERLPGARLAPGARVDLRLRLVVGPLELPAADGGRPPLVAVREVAVRPRLRALLAGRLEPASISLDGVLVSAGDGGDGLRELADRLRERRRGREAGPAAEPPLLAFSDLRVTWSTGSGGAASGPGASGPDDDLEADADPDAGDVSAAPGDAAGAPTLLEAGPFAGRLSGGRDEDGAPTLALRLRLPGGGLLAAEGPRSGDRLSLRLDGARAEAVPAALLRRLPAELRGGSLSGEATLRRAGPGRLRGPVALRLERLVVAGARLAAAPVGPISVAARGEVAIDLGARAIGVERLRVTPGDEPGASVEVSARLALRPEPWLALRATAPALDWAALSRALPAALAPGPGAPRVEGAFGLDLELEGPLRRADGWRVGGDLDLAGLRRTKDAALLDGPFLHLARLEGGRTREVLVGPANPAFVPLAALPPHVVRAVTASEDAGFFGHHGLDFRELSAALADGARRGRLRGASTITQQVAKNVFLTPERTGARKVREALVSVALEASQRKQRILEVYLNVAEWGPGVVGIGEAARHYFGKDARDLAPREAAFLATIIPNPIRYHRYYARGALTPAWDARVDALLGRLHALQVIDDAQLGQALAERLAFSHG